MTNGETQKEVTLEDRSQREDLSNDQCDEKNKDSAHEEKRMFDAPKDETPEKSHDVKEQDVIVSYEEAAGTSSTSNKSSASEIVKDQQPSTVMGSDDLKSEAELPPGFEKESVAISGEPPEPTNTSKDVEMSEPISREKSELQKTVPSNAVNEATNSAGALDKVDVVSDSLHPEKNEHQKPEIANTAAKPPSEAPRDVDMGAHSEHLQKNEPPPPVEPNATVEKQASMVLSFLF